jgi:hypothetical protein
MTREIGCDARPVAGRSLSDILFNGADFCLLKAVKEYSKRLACKLRCKAEVDAATTLYYAALASALVHHRKKISYFSYEKLEKSFRRLVRKRYVTSELRALFSNARTICQSRSRVK